jgi:hypothetical protein
MKSPVISRQEVRVDKGGSMTNINNNLSMHLSESVLGLEKKNRQVAYKELVVD